MSDVSSQAAAVPDGVATVAQTVDRHFPALVSDLEALVRIPSISAPAFPQENVARSAAAVRDLLADAGLPESEVLTVAGGRPAVVARTPEREGQVRVLLYAHHDVQPTGDSAEWKTDPFEPTRVGERLYGRGAADDKAGIALHLGALRTARDLGLLGTADGVGVTVFVEGEEESGSPTFVKFLRTYRDRLAADVIVVADSTNWKVGTPSLTTSLRGVATADVTLEVGTHAIHSGMYGGPVLDALTLLSRLVATLHDEDGSVAVAGLESIPDPDIDYTEEELRADAGVLPEVQLAGTGPLSARLWTRPAISVIGIDAPSVAHSSNTIQPRATARLSIRVAPGQDPQVAFQAVARHLEEHAPFGARVTVAAGENHGQGWLTAQAWPAVDVAIGSLRDAWGAEPALVGVGGSIPFIPDLQEEFPHAQVLVTGVEDPDSRAHGANESVHLGELRKAVVAEALLLQRLATKN